MTFLLGAQVAERTAIGFYLVFAVVAVGLEGQLIADDVRRLAITAAGTSGRGDGETHQKGDTGNHSHQCRSELLRVRRRSPP